MNKTIIVTDKAPAPIGPYSQAVKHGELIFVSGQIAIDPETNEMINGGVHEQGQRIMENIKAILEAANSSMSKVLKATVYVTSLDFFPTVNEVFGEYFESDYPARETVEVSRLPKNSDVEISVIAYS